MSKNRQKLNFDLDDLFPGKTLSFGDQSVLIRPLVLEQIAIISKRLKDILKALEKDGISWDNFEDPENAFKLATKMIVQFPDILEEVSNIDKDTLEKMPIEGVLKIIMAVVEVNIQSKDTLQGNFKSLIEMWTPLQKEKTQRKPKGKIKKKPKLPKSSKN